VQRIEAQRRAAMVDPVAYADFDFKVEYVDSTSCRVWVLNSPAGQADGICKLPFSLDQVGAVMADLGRQASRNLTPHLPGQGTPVSVGEALFRSIFTDAIGQLFFESLGRAQSQGQGLRLKIHVDPERSPQLAALPWEYLYNYRRRSFLGLSRLTPIVRYLDVQAPTMVPRISPPLRVLVVIASPKDRPPLNLAHERTLIEQAWGGQPDVLVEFLEAATKSALHTRLSDWKPHVLHFMGHGHFDAVTGSGNLLLVDEVHKSTPLSGKQMGVLFSNAPSVRLAVLNACQSAEISRSRALDPFSSVAAALVIAGLPAVVAMQFPISDQAALAFSNGFYSRLAGGDPVDVAVAFGRETLFLEMTSGQEWGTPVLFMRVSDGRPFKLGREESGQMTEESKDEKRTPASTSAGITIGGDVGPGAVIGGQGKVKAGNIFGGEVKAEHIAGRDIVFAGADEVSTKPGRRPPGTAAGMAPDLYSRLRAALLDCGPFGSEGELRAVFVDQRISPWRNHLPAAGNPMQRVEAIISFLYNQYSVAQENALVLLLKVLSEQNDPADVCQQRLAQLADELEHSIK
jgi:hypothetical protein